MISWISSSASPVLRMAMAPKA